MIAVTEADKIIAAHLRRVPAVVAPLREAHGRILCEDIAADRDVPAYNRATMDGLAVNSAAMPARPTRIRIEGTQSAGQPALRLNDPAAAIQIMTGAVLPEGCDAIVPAEEFRVDGDHAKLDAGDRPRAGQFVHPRGSDHRQGEVLLRAGTRLLSPQVAVLAAVGRSEVRVAGAPSVALVATGDELVDLGSDVEPYQIRPSNSYAIRAALAREQIVDTHLFQVRDDRPTLVHVLADVLKRFAVVILSGGVSMGKYDFVPLVLEQLGVTCLFHKIRQKPGKPLWFGVTTEGQPVFALPGNPVSALVCFHRYVLPGLRQAMGLTAAPPVRIPLAIALDLNPALTHYWPVRLVPGPAGNPLAQPLDYQGSGDYVPLAQSDGFIELAEGAAHNPAGGSVPFFPWN